MHDPIEQLVAMSKELGDPARDYVILGEGNTSVRADDESFWVKASGTQLATASRASFVRVRFEPVLAAVSNEEMSDAAVKELLKRDTQFKFRGDPDVSMLASPNESLIETRGISFIDRAYFQFHEGKLYTIILALDPERIDHYTMYTTLVDRYGEPNSLDPTEAIWEFAFIRMALERPLSVKYVDTAVFGSILRENAKAESLNSLNRDRFLDQF